MSDERKDGSLNYPRVALMVFRAFVKQKIKPGVNERRLSTKGVLGFDDMGEQFIGLFADLSHLPPTITISAGYYGNDSPYADPYPVIHCYSLVENLSVEQGLIMG